MPCKHILRLAGELGLFESERFAPGETDYTLESSFKSSSLPSILIEADNEALTKKYVKILHFIVYGRAVRIMKLKKELEDATDAKDIQDKTAQLKKLYSFTDEAREFKQYKRREEYDELLDILADMGLVQIIMEDEKSKKSKKKRKTVDVRLPDSMTLDEAKAILSEFNGMYPNLLEETVSSDYCAIFDNVIKTRRRSENIIRAHDAAVTSNWAFHVPKSFNDALDIKLVSRTKNSVNYAVWTQGANFAFDVGDIIYRDLASYEKGTSALQIISALKARGIKPEKLHKGKDSYTDIEDFDVDNDRYYPGEVVYKDFETGDTKTLTQMEFVKMLIGGEIAHA